MTEEQARKEQRRSYLRSELAVWSARIQRAETCETLRPLYWDHDLNRTIGTMRGELARLDAELGNTERVVSKNRRRINPNKGN